MCSRLGMKYDQDSILAFIKYYGNNAKCIKLKSLNGYSSLTSESLYFLQMSFKQSGKHSSFCDDWPFLRPDRTGSVDSRFVLPVFSCDAHCT